MCTYVRMRAGQVQTGLSLELSSGEYICLFVGTGMEGGGPRPLYEGVFCLSNKNRIRDFGEINCQDLPPGFHTFFVFYMYFLCFHDVTMGRPCVFLGKHWIYNNS